jgi:hypothetical protein
MKKLVLLSLFILPAILFAQDDKPKYGITFSGFVKSDFFYDSRQVVSIREGHFLLYPVNELLDANKKDINANPSLNFLSIQSRLSGKITGPDAFGAKTSGVIEADFFGNESAGLADLNGFRLRHGFAKLNWEKTELLFGQYWHPMFIPECFSGVISFNTGAPFQPFSRNPQMRLTYKTGNINFMAAAVMQRDFTSVSGSLPIRNSAMPDMNAQIFFKKKNEEAKTEILAGTGVGYKMLKPALYSEKGGKKYVTDATVSGITATVYAKYATDKFAVKMQGVYGQNAADLIMLGGYVPTHIEDTATNEVNYTTINNGSFWAEFQTKGEKIQFGLWAGYSLNLGSKDTIMNYPDKITSTTSPIPVRGANINYAYRVAPRVVFISGKFSFALEPEYTVASYMTKNDQGVSNINSNGQITESKDISNLRILFAVIYSF